MKILITGGSGNVGRYLIQELLKFDTYIINVSLNDLKDFENSANYKFYSVDITNKDAVEKVFITEKPDIVIHLASIIGNNCETDQKLTYQVNVGGTKILASLSAKYSVKKFVFTSTCAVYNQNELTPIKEIGTTDPKSYYGKTKLEAEKYLINLTNLPVIILRIFNIYGDSFGLSLINKLMESNKKNIVPIINPNNYFRDYIYYKDVINVISEAVLKNIAENKVIINVASGKATSTSELIKILSLKKNIYYKKITTNSALDVSWADISNLKKYLKYLPSQEIII